MDQQGIDGRIGCPQAGISGHLPERGVDDPAFGGVELHVHCQGRRVPDQARRRQGPGTGVLGTSHDEPTIPIASSLGRHTNDRKTSFYAVTPSGFQIEYGYGGVEIDDNAWNLRTYDAASTWGHRSPALT